ncbi:MAG: hypothetical protein D6806_00260, partial [Deltaproteobacteria bacterium]
ALAAACIEIAGRDHRYASAALSALLELTLQLVEQIMREAPGPAGAELGMDIRKWLEAIDPDSVDDWYLGELLEGVLGLGRRLALLGEEGEPPELWNEIQRTVCRLALRLARRKVEAEESCPEPAPSIGGEAFSLFAAIGGGQERKTERIERLLRRIEEDANDTMDVFLELTTWWRRNALDHLWQEWLGMVSARATEGHTEQVSRGLPGILSWLVRNCHDLLFLERAYRSLLRHVPYLAGVEGIAEALARAGEEIEKQKQRESGSPVERRLEEIGQLARRAVEMAARRPEPAVKEK